MKYLLNKLDRKKQIAIVILLIILLAYLTAQTLVFKKTIAKLNFEILTLNESILIKDEEIFNIKEENAKLNSVLNEEQRKVVFYEEKISEYSSEVVELTKLTTIDPELLKKYSKVYFLNEHYTPDDLVDIDDRYVYSKDKENKILYNVYPFFEEMMEAAERDDIDIKVVSSFRSFETQQNLKSKYTFVYGTGTANKFSADQGYSEHQLGTTVDFSTPKLNGGLDGFSKTEEYDWLQDNAHKYGFVLSYPDNNPYYTFEPWHWRFVGVALAKKIRGSGLTFYEWEQRDIDKYLINLFD